MKSIFSVRKILVTLLIVSIIFAAIATYYKIAVWGFSFHPGTHTDVWTIDAHISFKPTGKPIKVSLAIPRNSNEYKILSEDVVASGYETIKNADESRITISSGPKIKRQNIYYRVMLYDNADVAGNVGQIVPPLVEKPQFSNEQEQMMVEEIWNLADQQEGSPAKRIIEVLNAKIPDPTVDAFLPVKKTSAVMAEKIIYLLSYKGIAARVVRGVRLSEKRSSVPADFMLEVYEKKKWQPYNIETGVSGLPKNFVVFQRGGVSLFDVSGGKDSQIKFSVIKSVISSFKMAGSRAKYENSRWFDYTIYSLPTVEQNILKWLMIFPLGILLVVIMRNVIGITTMGTFTPMLLAMALVKTGFFAGLACFGLIVLCGLLIRTLLTKLNLLLVPRISTVVIVVIMIMQVLTVFGYQSGFKIAESAVFFPIIITAWIIERACITWEEEGTRNATKQIVNTALVAVVTYVVISSEYIRYIMFAFNEWNLVVLFVVMLLGTYTGYRLVELKRFSSLVKGK